MWTIRAGCLLAAALTMPLAAQDAPQVTVSVIDTAAPPEWELSVPIDSVVKGAPGVTRLSVRLVYPARPLTFVRVRPTDKLKEAGFTVKASAPAKLAELPATAPDSAKKAGKPQESSAITLTFVPEGDGARPPPTGRLAILVFKVGKDAEEKSYDVWTDAVQAEGAAKAAVTANAGKPAIFIVTPPGLPILSCFFYMH